MRQVLFFIPVPGALKEPDGPFGADGIPVHGFGLMLMLCMLLCMSFIVRQARKRGIQPERIADMVMVLLITGVIGARIFYMVQYKEPIDRFFNVWEGGMVLYGSLLAGTLAYIVFYRLKLRPLGVSTWVVADIIAPTLALGIALGRLGCLLNGCCYGQLAYPDNVQIHLPLLTGPARSTCVDEQMCQSILGFNSVPEIPLTLDKRTVVGRVEPGSEAQAAGLQAGDRILAYNGKTNGTYFYIRNRQREPLEAIARDVGTTLEPYFPPEEWKMLARNEAEALRIQNEILAIPGASILGRQERLSTDLNRWPKGKERLELVIERKGQEITLPRFTPRTLGLHPTQLYETISMVLLFFLLLHFQPFQRHDGQGFVVFLFVYSVHRFLNELLRNDTAPIIPSMGLTASMTVSLGVFSAAVILECYLRWSQRKSSTANQAS